MVGLTISPRRHSGMTSRSLAFTLGWAFFVVPISLASSIEQAKVVEVESRLLKQAADGAEKFRKGDAWLTFRTQDGQPLSGVNVEIRQKTHDFLFGALLFGLVSHPGSEPYRVEEYREQFKALFNMGVLPFYWEGYELAAGMPQWRRHEHVVEWALANGITLKGHPLVWSNPAGMPRWLYPLPVETTETLLSARVTSTVLGLAGKINLWDIVNEPVNMVSWRTAHADPSENEGARYKYIPIEEVARWIAPYYRLAHQVNPQATLVLNDFYQIMKPEVRQRFLSLVQQLKAERVPIGALGIQTHEPSDAWFPPEEVVKTLDLLGSLGYPLEITEFIPQSSGIPIAGGWREGRWTEQSQADYAEQIYRLAFGHPSVEVINWWGFSDRDAWRAGGGFVTAEYEPKLVYRRLMQLVHQEWETRLSATTDQEGRLKFRGFYGQYEILLKLPQGDLRGFTLHLSKKTGQENRFALTVGP
jgi:GH35 family endo-1,4-beta-xylanase